MSRQRGPITAAAIFAAGALLFGAVGCGAIDPRQAPVDADVNDFCKSYARLAGADAATSAKDMENYLNELAHFGTPRGIPTAARNGFEYVIDADHAFTDGAQFAALASQPDAAGQDAAALKAYAGQVCAS